MFFIEGYDENRVAVFKITEDSSPYNKRLLEPNRPLIRWSDLSTFLSRYAGSESPLSHSKIRLIQKAVERFGSTKVRYVPPADIWIVDAKGSLRDAAVRLAYKNPGIIQDLILPCLRG